MDEVLADLELQAVRQHAPGGIGLVLFEQALPSARFIQKAPARVISGTIETEFSIVQCDSTEFQIGPALSKFGVAAQVKQGLQINAFERWGKLLLLGLEG